jgi:uncharacterized protein (DUF1501 family)
MRISRRSFLKGVSGTAALLASPHVLARSFGARRARAAGPADPILVIVQLEGGNDGANTVIPLNDVPGFPQRTLYESFRPSIGIDTSLLGPTTIDDDPELGNGLALHPTMTDLWALYDQGKVAICNAVGYPSPNLSHFRSEDIWYRADPDGLPPTGWVGNYLDQYVPPGEILAISFDRVTSTIFTSLQSDAIGTKRLSLFVLPDDPSYPDVENRRLAWEAIYQDASGQPAVIGQIGATAFGMVVRTELLSQIQTSGWGSNLDGKSYSLAKAFRETASVIRHDVLNPSDDTGLRCFHVRSGGFDTHSRQGAEEVDGRHGALLWKVSESIKAFYDDMAALGVSDRVLLITFSEFGRRPEENASGSSAGTDHGTAAPLFVVGDGVVGGVHGRIPDFQDLDGKGNFKFQTDFRQVYATVIDRWLGADHTLVLPGAPYTHVPALP